MTDARQGLGLALALVREQQAYTCWSAALELVVSRSAGRSRVRQSTRGTKAQSTRHTETQAAPCCSLSRLWLLRLRLRGSDRDRRSLTPDRLGSVSPISGEREHAQVSECCSGSSVLSFAGRSRVRQSTRGTKPRQAHGDTMCHVFLSALGISLYAAHQVVRQACLATLFGGYPCLYWRWVVAELQPAVVTARHTLKLWLTLTLLRTPLV